MKRLATWNINGIRAACGKGLGQWIAKEKPWVICLQEIKAKQDQIPQDIVQSSYHIAICPAQKAGYSGVMTMSQIAPQDIEYGLGVPKFDKEGRTLIHYFKNFILLNCYFPNGQRDHKRVPYKMAYCQAIQEKCLQLEKYKLPIVITGDFNTAHCEVDLANPKSNQKTTGFLPQEREWIDQFIEQGYYDIYREKYPEKKNQYSWWTYRSNCRERNIGWRIDYFFGNEKALKKTSDCYYQDQQLGSDHCPQFLEIKL